MADTWRMVEPTEPTRSVKSDDPCDEWATASQSATDVDDGGVDNDGERAGENGRSGNVSRGDRFGTSNGRGRARVIENRAKRREEFQQLLAHRPDPEEPFAGTRFPAWLMPRGIKFTGLGDAQLTLIVPYRFKEQVLSLIRGHAVILDVDIDPWEREDVDDETKQAMKT